MAGFDNEVLNCDNVDFRGTKPVTGQMVSDGQLLIGSTASPNIKAGSLASADGSVTISVGSGTIDLSAAAGVTLPVSIPNGGTGQTSKTEGFDALSPTTTKGDIIVNNGTDNIRVAVGADDTVLTAKSSETSGVIFAAAGGGGEESMHMPPISQTDVTSIGLSIIPGGIETDVNTPWSNLLGLGDVIYYPAYVAKTTTYNDISMKLGTAGTAGNVCELILYNIGSDGLPSTKAFESGSIAIDSTSTVSAVIDTSITAGRYWIGILLDNGNVADGGAVECVQLTDGALMRNFHNVTNTSLKHNCLLKTGTYTVGNAPASPTGLTLAQENCPLIWLEID